MHRNRAPSITRRSDRGCDRGSQPQYAGPGPSRPVPHNRPDPEVVPSNNVRWTSEQTTLKCNELLKLSCACGT
jgi:hypothetical protein